MTGSFSFPATFADVDVRLPKMDCVHFAPPFLSSLSPSQAKRGRQTNLHSPPPCVSPCSSSSACKRHVSSTTRVTIDRLMCLHVLFFLSHFLGAACRQPLPLPPPSSFHTRAISCSTAAAAAVAAAAAPPRPKLLPTPTRTLLLLPTQPLLSSLLPRLATICFCRWHFLFMVLLLLTARCITPDMRSTTCAISYTVSYITVCSNNMSMRETKTHDSTSMAVAKARFS